MENLQILLRQHVGKPCAPIVKVGDKVKKGTLIAEPTGLGANIFSSAYGVVEEITDEMIVIKPDEEQKDEFVPIEEGTPLEMVRAAGVVGMGGAGFPTAVKLDAHFEDGGYILVNASECEPGLKHNIQQIEEEPEKVIRGVKLCMEISGADKAIIAIKKKNRKAVEILDECLKDEPNITRHLLPDIYPMGEERAVVRECLGIELEPSQLPSAAKSVVINSETCSRVAEAVDERKPSFLKHLTVRGKLNGGHDAHVFMDVPVGTSVGALIERAGGIDGEYGEIVMGGAFTGKSTTLDAPITKTTGAILVLCHSWIYTEQAWESSFAHVVVTMRECRNFARSTTQRKFLTATASRHRKCLMVQESARDQETAQVRYQTTYSSRRISVNTLLSETAQIVRTL